LVLSCLVFLVWLSREDPQGLERVSNVSWKWTAQPAPLTSEK
jgi:hypothetical protein